MVRHRKTRRRYEVPGQARFITFSCQHRLQLFDDDALKDRFADHLAEARQRTHFQLIGWVIMPEHVHLLMIPSLPGFPVHRVLKSLKGRFSKEVLSQWRTDGNAVLAQLREPDGAHRFWLAGGGYDVNIVADQVPEKIDYMHDNPRKRGLVRCATDWRWSSARWYDGHRGPDVLVMDPIHC